MAYDQATDLQQIQADVLTADTSANTSIKGANKLKTNNKSVLKAINELNTQLKSASQMAAAAVTRANEVDFSDDITALKGNVTSLKAADEALSTGLDEANTAIDGVKADLSSTQSEVSTLKTKVDAFGNQSQGGSDNSAGPRVSSDELDELRLYLRLDSDMSGELEMLLTTAQEYIQTSTGKKYDPENKLMRLCAKILSAHWFECRGVQGSPQEYAYSATVLLQQIAVQPDEEAADP